MTQLSARTIEYHSLPNTVSVIYTTKVSTPDKRFIGMLVAVLCQTHEFTVFNAGIYNDPILIFCLDICPNDRLPFLPIN